jgi:hypothetical protein
MVTPSPPAGPFKALADKTLQNHQQGVLYDAYAAQNDMTLIDDMTLDMLTNNDGQYIKTCLEGYAQYLIELPKKRATQEGEKDEYYKPGTQTQYLSNAKNRISKKFPKATVIQKGHPDNAWFKSLYDTLFVRACVLAIKRGEQIKSSTLGIRKKLLLRIAKALVDIGSANSYEERAVILSLYHAVGRGGEISNTTFEAMEWNEEEAALFLNWPSQKTGTEGDISMHPNAKGQYLTDWIHAIACYIVTCAGRLGQANNNPNDPSWLFPGYNDLADGGAASKASRILKKLWESGAVEGLRKEHTAHGLRAGSSDDMATNMYCHLVAMIARGNWDWTGDCQIFGYVTKKQHVATAGKALAELDDCRQHLPAPSLDALTEENRSAADKLAFHLFLHGPDELQPSGHLVKFRDAMVASLLMYFEEMEKDLGHSDAVVNVLVETSTRCEIELGQLRAWGGAIRKKFQNDLRGGSCSGTKLEQAESTIAILEDQLEKQIELNANLTKRIGRLESMILTLQQGMDSLLQYFSRGGDGNDDIAQQSPKRKKRQVEATEETVSAHASSMAISPPNGAPSTLNDMLMGNAKKKGPPKPFASSKTLMQTTVATLLVKVASVKCVSFSRDAKDWGVGKREKSKAKIVYDYVLKNHATAQEKILLRTTPPVVEDVDSIQQYYKSLNGAANSVANKFLKELQAQQELVSPGKPLHVKALNNLTVTAAKTLLENFKMK